jgi:hypothetical protein
MRYFHIPFKGLCNSGVRFGRVVKRMALSHACRHIFTALLIIKNRVADYPSDNPLGVPSREFDYLLKKSIYYGIYELGENLHGNAR